MATPADEWGSGLGWQRQTVKAAAPFDEVARRGQRIGIPKGRPFGRSQGSCEALVTRINKKSGQRGCNSECPEWRGCKAGRRWVTGPMPCETLLPFEVENEFEADSSPSLWVIPIQVRVNVEAMG